VQKQIADGAKVALGHDLKRLGGLLSAVHDLIALENPTPPGDEHAELILERLADYAYNVSTDLITGPQKK
jgi:hypothetical protein